MAPNPSKSSVIKSTVHIRRDYIRIPRSMATVDAIEDRRSDRIMSPNTDSLPTAQAKSQIQIGRSVHMSPSPRPIGRRNISLPIRAVTASTNNTRRPRNRQSRIHKITNPKEMARTSVRKQRR